MPGESSVARGETGGRAIGCTLIRFSASAERESEAGVTTDVQSGERIEFADLANLKRFIRERLDLKRQMVAGGHFSYPLE